MTTPSGGVMSNQIRMTLCLICLGGGLTITSQSMADDLAIDPESQDSSLEIVTSVSTRSDLRAKSALQQQRDALRGEFAQVRELRFNSRNRMATVEAAWISSLDTEDIDGSGKELIARLSPLLGLVGDESFELGRRGKVGGGKTVLKFDQNHLGRPVLGARVTMRMRDVDGAIDRIESTAAPMRSAAMDPAVDGASAAEAAIVAKRLEAFYESSRTPSLAYFINSSLEPILVWDVALFDRSGAAVPQRVLIDAADGSVAATFQRARHAVDRTLWSQNHEQPTPPLGYRRYLICTEGQTCNDTAAATLKPILGSVHQYFDSVFDHDGLDEEGGTIHAAVHMNISNNALWDETTVTLAFGDGDITMDPTWSDHDFVSHEYMHGVTQYKAQNNLGNTGQAQAIDEGLSDVFAAAYDAHRNGGSPDASTWLWAEEIWTPAEEGDAIRYLHRPKLDIDQPNPGDVSLDCFSEYLAAIEAEQEPEAHRANGILNLAFYLLSQGGYHPSTTVPSQPDCSTLFVPGVGIATAAKAFFDSIEFFETGQTFALMRSDTASAAQSEFGSAVHDKVHLAWDAVGVPGSPNVLPLELPTPPGLAIDSSACYGVHELWWDAPEAPGGAPTRYEVEFDHLSTFPSPALVYDGPETSRVITVEESGYFRARACNNAGCATTWRKSMKALYYTTCP